jgi:hypothetical protein
MNFRTFFPSVLLAIAASAHAGPGAHGPNGEHLDAPAQAGGTSSVPRMAAQSELFELVATLHADELSILVDRFATNEPVLEAQVEVETGGARAKARFHADHGDYSIDDPAFLKVVSAPGEHALVVTVISGKDTDLLDGRLVVAAAPTEDHGHSHGDGTAHAHESGNLVRNAIIVAGLSVLALVAWLVQRRRGRGGVEVRS